MGIRGLIRRLEPYAEHVKYTGTESSAEHDRAPRLAVVDGPALCFHILGLCLAQRGRRSSPFDRLPTLHELAEATITWLHRLQRHGFVIQAILFDGFLPESKRRERAKRWQEFVNSLFGYRARYPDARLGEMSSPSYDLFDVEVVPRSQEKLQLVAPPSFVAAIIDGLYLSQFSRVTRVVPGEADYCCAEEARRGSAYIFTGDSDLLAYNIGVGSRVVFLKDVEFTSSEDVPNMSSVQYDPERLARLFELPNLLALSYFASLDPLRGIPECAALARDETPAGTRWDDFTAPYLVQEHPVAIRSSAHVDTLTDAIRYTNPRVLELVLQLHFPSSTAETVSRCRTIYVFPPTLLEDPAKASALQPSSDLRMTVYNVVGLLDSSVSSVSEYCRRDKDIFATPISLKPRAQALEDAIQFSAWLTTSLKSYGDAPPVLAWRMIAATILCDTKRKSNKTLPATTLLEGLVLNNASKSLSWSLLHATAELHGVLLYLGFLSAVLRFTDTIESCISLPDDVLYALRALTEALWTLPGFQDLYSWDHRMAQGLTDVTMQHIRAELSRITISPDARTSTTKTAKKSKALNNAQRSDQIGSGLRTGNMYDILDSAQG